MPFCTNCGKMAEQNQEVCTRCGITLTNIEDTKPSIKFLAPLDFSDVRSVIPEGAKVFKGSILDSVAIHHALQGNDYVVHLAARLGVKRTEVERLSWPIHCSRRVLSGLRSGVNKHSIESDVRELAQ